MMRKPAYVLVTMAQSTAWSDDGWAQEVRHYWCGPERPSEWHSRPDSYRAGSRRLWLTDERTQARRYDTIENAVAAALLGPEGMFNVELW